MENIKKSFKIYVKYFSDAKMVCMQDYIKYQTIVENKPDHFILHVGTNDLVTGASPEEM